MEIEVHQAMDEQARAANRRAHPDPARFVSQPLAQVREGPPKEDHQRQQDQRAARQPRFGQRLGVVVVGVGEHQVRSKTLIPGINILEARCTVNHPMVKNRFVVEVGDTRTLDHSINRLRNIDAVFDAYRVTPGAG